jgi:urease accessory protein
MRWLDALHVLDSSFPTGAYVHSFGLETLTPTLDQLEAVLADRLEQTIGRLELVYVWHAFTQDLVDLDERFHATQLTRETRAASSLIGQNLLRAVAELYAAPSVAISTLQDGTASLPEVRLRMFLREGRHHHYPVAFGAVAAVLDLPRCLAAETYAFGALRGQVSAAQRLGRLGQRDAQRLLHALKPRVHAAVDQAAALQLHEAGAFAPAWDIASMRHEGARARMFAS